MHPSKKIFKVILWISGSIIGLLLIAYLGLNALIYWGVRAEAKKAMAAFHGDRVAALIAVVDCDACDLRDRNHAVWALGQLHDKRALPVLHKYYTGKPCDHRRRVCQYELSKAIKWTEGKAYTAPQLWRPLI
jgi:hypothetical protein